MVLAIFSFWAVSVMDTYYWLFYSIAHVPIHVSRPQSESLTLIDKELDPWRFWFLMKIIGVMMINQFQEVSTSLHCSPVITRWKVYTNWRREVFLQFEKTFYGSEYRIDQNLTLTGKSQSNYIELVLWNGDSDFSVGN